jgi:hypothetical protein
MPEEFGFGKSDETELALAEQRSDFGGLLGRASILSPPWAHKNLPFIFE